MNLINCRELLIFDAKSEARLWSKINQKIVDSSVYERLQNRYGKAAKNCESKVSSLLCVYIRHLLVQKLVFCIIYDVSALASTMNRK